MDYIHSENETRSPSAPPSLEELSRRGERSLFLPYIIGLVSNSSVHRSPREVLVLVNFRTGSISMVESSGQIEEILRGKEGPLPASKSSIEGMPEVDVMEEEFECAICLTGVGGDGVVVKEMPCKHKFHSGCIEKWLGIHGSCPVCRYQMPVEEEERDNKNERDGDGENDGDGESDGEGEEEGDGESGGEILSGTGFVFHIYVAASRRRESGSDTMNMENENDGLGEGNSDMDVDSN